MSNDTGTADRGGTGEGGGESKLVVYASIAANVAIATTKYIAAAISGSAGMLAEAIHSTVDACDGSLILFGTHRSKRPPDAQHPFGHGKEIYFWAFVVAVLFFMLGGVLSVYRGVLRTLDPEPLGRATLSYIVLGVAALFDGTSFVIGVRRFRRDAAGRGVWTFINRTKDPTVTTVVLEDSADLLGIVTAAAGVFLSHQLQMPMIDGIASIIIGLILCALAAILLVQTHGLLIGERADAELLRSVEQIVNATPHVVASEPPTTLQLGPHDVLVAVRLDLEAGNSLGDAARAVHDIERRVRATHSDVRRVFVDARSFQGDP